MPILIVGIFQCILPIANKACFQRVKAMAGPIGKLTDLKLRNAKPAEKIQKLSDGQGLQLWITPAGGKYWRLEYRFGGKKKLLSIGPYPEISAASARAAAAKAREQLRQGLDPSEMKKEAKVAAVAAVEHSFGNLAKRLIEKKRREKRADVTLAKMEWIFGKIEADLDHRPIQEISTPDIIRRAQERRRSRQSWKRHAGCGRPLGKSFDMPCSTASSSLILSRQPAALSRGLNRITMQLLSSLKNSPGCFA